MATSVRRETQPTCAEAALMPAVTRLWDRAPLTGRKSVPHAWAWVVVGRFEAVLPSPFPKPLDEMQPFHKKWWRNRGSEQGHPSCLRGAVGGDIGGNRERASSSRPTHQESCV